AVTSTDGSFRFDVVPAGSYTLKAWHEESGQKPVTISVRARATTEAPVSLDVSGFTAQAHKNKYGKDYPPPAPGDEREGGADLGRSGSPERETPHSGAESPASRAAPILADDQDLPGCRAPDRDRGRSRYRDFRLPGRPDRRRENQRRSEKGRT